MINVFRNIRQNLLIDGKTVKYIKYAIGEIVLVVIGILIALSINNWNESRKQAIAEKEFITGVKIDLEQDKAYIKLVIRQAEKKLMAFELLSKKDPALYDTDKKALDSLLHIYFVSERTFYPISGSFESALSGNEINNFKNKKTIATIIKLYNSTYDRLIDNGNISSNRWEYLTKKYSHERRIGTWLEMNPIQFSELLDDLSYHSKELDWYRAMLIESLKDINAIVQEN
ncbi:MAG: DUF6090 family protein [Maribacter sp.]|nr:DUF6090 family protein [Maribacter sp.]